MCTVYYIVKNMRLVYLLQDGARPQFHNTHIFVENTKGSFFSPSKNKLITQTIDVRESSRATGSPATLYIYITAVLYHHL